VNVVPALLNQISSFMKLILFTAACMAAILSSPYTACSQHYYVVVGAFSAEENASELKAYLPDQLLDSSYIVPKNESLMHLYVLKTSDRESAIARTLHLKKAIESWNTTGALATNNRLEGVISKEEPMLASETANSSDESSTGSAAASVGAPNSGTIPAKPVGKYFKFKIESPEGKAIPGKVHHVDLENGRELAAYSSGAFVDLLRPGQNSEPMTVVCGLFGYKEVFKHVNYADPTLTDKEAYVDAQGAWVIPYKLERLEKGDVSVMYNVTFYKDAVVMRKPSQTDLDELVKMMHSNPYYEITIHSHCNGKNKREIIALGPDKNYFDVAGSVTMNGSAKNLTALRAEAIRSYLADRGIDAGRTKIFSWGGSDMLVKGGSPDSSLNDRIEIEITRD
jgi:outer membrane protein OmpA-like peptidoglycan-associated protein